MLTAAAIRDAQPEAKTRILWDEKLKGLGLRIAPGGTKAFILNYRSGGRERRATLARVGEVSLKTARQMAGEQLVRVREGADPLDERQQRREAPTVNDGVSRFFDEFVPERIKLGRMSPKTASEYRKQWRCYLAPKLGKRKIAEVQRRHVERAIDGTPTVTRNRLIALVSRLFSLFEHWEWREQHTNPARGVERGREEPRDRVLSPSELAALALALNQYEGNPVAVAAIRVTALTGLRIGEILAMKWEHIDFESGRLVLPATKTGRRQHDLPAPALDVLRQLPRCCDWVFSARRGVPSTYRNIRFHFQHICTLAGIEGVKIHDLRRTIMTMAAASGIGVHVLRDLLGHKTTAMADRYIRFVGNPVREAREQVAAEVAKAMGANLEVS